MESAAHKNNENITAELIRMLAQQGRITPAPMLAALAVIAFFASDTLPRALWAGWFSVAAILLFVRAQLLARLPEMTQFSQRQRLNFTLLITFLNGVMHGLPLLCFGYFTELERAVITMILLGTSSINVSTTAGYRPIAVAYTLPTLGLAACVWGVHGWGTPMDWTSLSVAGLIVCYLPLLIKLAGNGFRIFESSYRERLVQSAVNTQLQNILEQAESASSAKTRFLASASHDLRQPIHALSLFGSALSKRPLDEESRDIVMHMETALKALASQLDSLLDISKLDAGVVNINKQTFNLLDMAERLQVEFGPAAEEKGLSVWLDCYVDVYVDTDEILFERILRNLLSNAIKYTDHGKIMLSINAEEELVTVSVVDSGRGIPKNEQQRVFEEFYQLENPERDRRKGLGLGLAIVKRLVKLLDIKFSLYSVPSDGTRISLTLPISESTPVTTPDKPKVVASWESLRLLVVDDEMEVGLGMQALLETFGATVDVADSTASALELALANRPDILLADFRLRGEDNGLETIRNLRAIYPKLPAILISGDTAPDRLREANEAGIKLLHKPVAAPALEDAIAEACNLAVTET
ncbi:hybrid sensor histidine kinase/response regulator [Simiduia sp. 21SJ11W-1]|uniref:hybrid sensor histidine kinase/response regulator n=1 Tax=Simiduia sp. 21SJ11W-1 TaxID=2909669 RepID=UPI00209DE22C|nr:hybrid sensor histidine kinase/response regulator [Simiduia sp. 21SJ11W-1]UTA47178.1 hybrid sensor histidine kinase/response regulator [Simiduia sp. 21SJ11W-1]